MQAPMLQDTVSIFFSAHERQLRRFAMTRTPHHAFVDVGERNEVFYMFILVSARGTPPL